jgi:hypothetical protein
MLHDGRERESKEKPKKISTLDFLLVIVWRIIFSFMTRYNHFSGPARGASCEPEAQPRTSSAEETAGKVKKN